MSGLLFPVQFSDGRALAEPTSIMRINMGVALLI